MSAVTEMLDSVLMAAVAWARCFGLPLCAATSAAPVAEDTASRGVLPRYKNARNIAAMATSFQLTDLRGIIAKATAPNTHPANRIAIRLI